MGNTPEVASSKQSHQLCGKLSSTIGVHSVPLSAGFGAQHVPGAFRAAEVPCTRLSTLYPFPFQYKGANIQLLDLPGIIEGAAQGWLISMLM